jgi:TRAP-type C4-dicarboxylate transport system permease small subunit
MLRFIDRLTRAVALYGGGALLSTLLGLIVIDVTGRYLFSAPVFGSLDLYGVLLALIVAVSIGYGGRSGAHVSADVFARLVGPRTERVIGIGVKLLAAGVMAASSWQLMANGRISAQLGESTQLLNIPFQPIYDALGLGIALYTVVLLLEAWSLAVHGDAPVLMDAGPTQERRE